MQNRLKNLSNSENLRLIVNLTNLSTEAKGLALALENGDQIDLRHSQHEIEDYFNVINRLINSALNPGDRNLFRSDR